MQRREGGHLSLRLLSLSYSVTSNSFPTPWTVALQAPLTMGISQARILEWVAVSFSRGSSRPRDQTRISCIALYCRWVLYCWASREATHLCSLLIVTVPLQSPPSSRLPLLHTSHLEQQTADSSWYWQSPTNQFCHRGSLATWLLRNTETFSHWKYWYNYIKIWRGEKRQNKTGDLTVIMVWPYPAVGLQDWSFPSLVQQCSLWKEVELHKV